MKKMKKLDPIRPNAGTRIEYQRRMERLIDEMTMDVQRELTATYRYESERSAIIASDASPITALRREFRRMARRWIKRFDDAAPEISAWFATKSSDRVDSQMQAMLAKAGFTVQFNATAAQQQAYGSIVAQNVALIGSIPDQYMTAIEGAAMRAFATGSNTKILVDELVNTAGVTRRRAQNIARDQSNKTIAALARVRQLESGITKAVWQHSHGAAIPRPEHIAFSGQIYDVKKGAYLEGKWVWPGTEINCGCISIPIVPGLDVPVAVRPGD